MKAGGHMKRLTERDRDRILEYVGQEPEYNIFFIGDIENFGVEGKDISIYANEINEIWDSLVLIFMGNSVVYSRNPAYDAEAVARFLKTKAVDMISGKAEIIARLTDYFPERRYRTTIMTKCDHLLTSVNASDEIDIRRLTPEDADIIADFMALIEEFHNTTKDRVSHIKSLRTNLARGTLAFGAFKNGMLISAARATAGNKQSAMIAGVATHPDERGNGYASAVVSKVCRISFDEGKKFLCLFYSNPMAGRIYNRLGFLPFGEYALFN